MKNLIRWLRGGLAALALLATLASPLPARAAAGTWTLYANAKLQSWGAAFNIGTDTFVMVLLSASYTPAVNTDATWADVSAYEVSCTGYTAGGATATLSKALAAGTVTVSMTTVSWTSSTCTAKYAAIVRRAGGSLVSGDKLLTYLDLNTASGSATVSTTNGTLSVSASSGLFTQ